MSQQPYETGALYKALSKTELEKLDIEKIDGLKLHVFPQQLKPLRELQRSLRKRFGTKPNLKLVLNAVLANCSFDEQLVSQWIISFYIGKKHADSNDLHS
jgi:hypothetical protein